MKLLFLGDVFGSPGRKALQNNLPSLKQKLGIDVCIVNCENAAAGRGITEKTCRVLFEAGADVLTGGNHLWDKKEGVEYLEKEKRIVKPANFELAVGNDYYIHTVGELKLCVLNFCGQVFMNTPSSPFFVCERYLENLKDKADLFFVDFHAEATGEKLAFARYFDGKVTAVVGTHTHIQTADEQILKNGTAYISDAGMTGPHDSIIGVEVQNIIDKTLTGMPKRFEVAKGDVQINGVVITIDETSKKATKIERIRIKTDD